MYQEYNRLLTFCSVRHAIRAEELLRKAGVKVVSLPIPREIDITCGQCLLFMADQEVQLMAVLRDKNVYWAELFARDGVNKNYEKLAEFEDKIKGV
jgi:hypothetical protein